MTAPTGLPGFRASVLADVEGVFDDETVERLSQRVAERVAELLDERAPGAGSDDELEQLREALRMLERAPWWRRGRLLKRVSAQALESPVRGRPG